MPFEESWGAGQSRFAVPSQPLPIGEDFDKPLMLVFVKQNNFFSCAKSNRATLVTEVRPLKERAIHSGTMSYLFSIMAWRTWQANFTLKHRIVALAV